MRPTGEYDLNYFRVAKKLQKNQKRLEELLAIVKRYNPKKVLDVGCGIGYFVEFMRKDGIGATGIDNAPDLRHFWGKKPYFIRGVASALPFDDGAFDLVFSSDFFEHVPEEQIDDVANEMKRVSKTVLARVAYEAKLDKIQARYHVTNKPKDFWIKKLSGIILI